LKARPWGRAARDGDAQALARNRRPARRDPHQHPAPILIAECAGPDRRRHRAAPNAPSSATASRYILRNSESTVVVVSLPAGWHRAWKLLRQAGARQRRSCAARGGEDVEVVAFDAAHDATCDLLGADHAAAQRARRWLIGLGDGLRDLESAHSHRVRRDVGCYDHRA
jgi:hypothetical protein